jgi:hypothetical protein
MQIRLDRRLTLSRTAPKRRLPGLRPKTFFSKPEMPIIAPMKAWARGPFSFTPFITPAMILLKTIGTQRNIVTLASLRSLKTCLIAMRFPKTSSAPTDMASMKTASMV